MRNIKLTIEYDGTNYWGWQAQKDYPSVEYAVEKAVRKVTGEKNILTASGRTDAKVHALAQVANFYTNSTIPGDRFLYAINDKLPEDIRIIKSEEVSKEFHSRFSAKRKKYIYKVHLSEIERPLLRNYTYNISYPLNIELMKESAKDFIGTFDYTSFRGRRSSIKSSTRTVYSVEIKQIDDIILFSIEGNAFLRNMVRIMVGTLLEIGIGQREPHSIPEIIKAQDRKKAGHTAPAQGLYLDKVYYD